MTRKMEPFNLNTAVSFLPVMDDTENVTKQLISSINMYNTLLDNESKPVLINFILTTRLSPSAKIRLSKNYKTVEHLVSDMNKHLLTKKSFAAIQQQLSQCTQKQKSIDAYGKEIETLFVDLTISQADGDQNKHKVLRPINEKIAINRFATGLQNSNLSTIVLARNYQTLKDAIQGAKDEQTSLSTSNVKLDSKQFPNSNMAHSGLGRGHGSQGRGGQTRQNIQRGGHSSQGNARGNNHSMNHHNQAGFAKNFDNREGNNNFQRGQSQCSRGNLQGAHQSGNQHNQGAPGKNFDNRDGSNHSQRGQSQCSRGNSRGAHQSGIQHNQWALGKSFNNRDGSNHSQRGGGQHFRGNSRGAHQSGNQHNQGAPSKNFDNCDGSNHSQRSGSQHFRGNSRGTNQPGSYHNQGNRGKNNNNRGGDNNNVPRPANVPEIQVDCQFRFNATVGNINVKPANTSNNTPGPNTSKQLSKFK